LLETLTSFGYCFDEILSAVGISTFFGHRYTIPKNSDYSILLYRWATRDIDILKRYNCILPNYLRSRRGAMADLGSPQSGAG
jgi:hypothetical protein